MNFFDSYVSSKAKQYVGEVLDSGMLSEGEWTRKFERAVEDFHGYDKNTVVATNSGTSALHLALKTLGMGEGDEVIIPPLTFVATGLAVLYCGAKPVFADIGEDGCISPSDVRKKICHKTKAVIAVNWAGKDFDEELYEVVKKYGLKLIVDAAQSFGTRRDGDAVCFSFQATKHVTCGDGGAVYFPYPQDYKRGRRLSWFGIDKESDLPDILGERVYNLDEVGYKYHMNNIAAALGLGNIEAGVGIVWRRRNIASRYHSELHSVKPVHLGNSSYWAYPIRVADARRFSAYCEGAGVPHSIIHKGIDQYAIFGKLDESLTEMRRWERTVVHLPIHCAMTVEDVDFIIEKVSEYVE